MNVERNIMYETVARLEADWPNWQIWVIHPAVGAVVWCARRWDGSGPVLNADSANELVEDLEAEAVQ
jgi:hypothetical protein